MSVVNQIQERIIQLDGGSFQSLFDEYLYKRYKFKNIQTLGVQTGTNKPTKGTPDSYVQMDNGNFILINYGSVCDQPADKIKADILSCFNTTKLNLEKEKIKKIICGHCSTNIHIEQFIDIKESIEGVEIELIGIDTLSHDLALNYPHISKSHLGITIDTNQFFDVEDFVKAYDANGINAPIDCAFLHRNDEIDNVCKSIEGHVVTVLIGPSGIGKTRLAVEACRKCSSSEDRKVYCVRSNGILLYEDIKYYVDEPGKYLIFFDDANMVVSLYNVLNTLLTLPQEYEIKILATVRDYAKDKVIETVCRYYTPKVIKIGKFKDDEVKDILKSDLGITNHDYLNKIAEISNGNIRLAFLAGIRSIDNGYQAIQNAEDIFRNYYSQIINDTKITKSDIIMLFFITVAGPVRESENMLYKELKTLYGAEIPEEETISKLYSLELIDWFKDEVTKISDQSFGNYILYYVLFEKRWVSIETLISISFPKYREKAIYTLRTLLEIFNSDEVSQYIEESIISAWNNAPEDQEIAYLESFYQVDSDKTLSILKEHIDNEESIEFDLAGFDFETKKNYNRVETKGIEILGGYKYTDNHEDAIDLLLLYFSKRPDLVMDFYFTIINRLLYDKHSWRTKYRQEAVLIDKLWNSTQNGENCNSTILYLNVVEYALKTEFTYTEEIRNSRSVNFERMQVGFCEEIIALRKKLWETLGVLRRKSDYCDKVNEILLKVHFNDLDEDASKSFLQSDFDLIYENIVGSDKLNFYDAKTIDRYREVAKQINATTDERYFRACENPEFKLYRILTREHEIGMTIEEDEKIRRDSIAGEIKNYKVSDYKKLFELCCFIEKEVSERDQRSLNTGLDTVFEILEDNSDMYIKVITEYLKQNAPFRLNGYKQVRYLLNCIGYNQTYEMLSSREYNNRDMWMYCIWDSIDSENVTDEIVSDYKEFVTVNLEKKDAIVPSFSVLDTYGGKDADLRNMMIKALVERPELSSRFLKCVFRDEDAELLMNIFQDDIDTLSEIYVNAIKVSDHIDYGGKLFERIFNVKPHIWNEYIDLIKDNAQRDGYEEKVFEVIWKCDNWKSCIEYAFDNLIYNQYGLFIESVAMSLFGKTQNPEIMHRKKQWLLNELKENIEDLKKVRSMVEVVVTVMPEWKAEYLIEFIKRNKQIQDFKKLYLFPTSASWYGSEVPLIIDKIKFLQALKEKLKGIEYIKHRIYIEDYRRDLKNYKKKVELREYIENADYA